jgi:hypothetical protein
VQYVDSEIRKLLICLGCVRQVPLLAADKGTTGNQLQSRGFQLLKILDEGRFGKVSSNTLQINLNAKRMSGR